MKLPSNTLVPAIATALILPLAYQPLQIHMLAWIGLVPFLYQAHSLTPRAAAGRFFFAGWLFHTAVLHWLVVNVYWAGIWAIVGQQFLCVIMGLYWALLGVCWTWLRTVSPRLGSASSFALLWMGMEKLQETLFTGFGWSALGYSQGPNLLFSQWASLGSVPLVSAILVFVNMQLALSLAQAERRVLRLGLTLCTVVGVHAVGWGLLEEADYTSRPYQVVTFQPNYSQQSKWDRGMRDEMVRQAIDSSNRMLRVSPADLVVWPEAHVMAPIDTPGIREEIEAFVTNANVNLLTGAVRHAEGGGQLNTAHLVRKDGTLAGHYDKIHLTPFGEYAPFSDVFPFIGRVVPAIGDLKAGSKPVAFEANGRTFGPLICFEVIFPELAENVREMGADFLVVITNLGWFGSSAGIPQEIEVARFRAIETRLPLVHCANTGISGTFDPYGRFELINGIVTENGSVYNLREDLQPRDTIRGRLVGTFSLAAPGSRVLPIAPTTVPWLAIGLSVIVMLAAAFNHSHVAKANAPSSEKKS